MSNLIFGIVFTGISLFMAFMFYGPFEGEITVNGEYVTQAEFNELLWPKILLAVFFVIGVVFLIRALCSLFKNAKTSIAGVETYGIITRVMETNVYVNDYPVMKGEIAVVCDGYVKLFEEDLGIDCKKGYLGDCLIVKQCGDDINIIGTEYFEYLPPNVQTLLKPYYDIAKNELGRMN